MNKKDRKKIRDLAKKIVENPKQVEQILNSLETKSELNPLLEELLHMRRSPKKFFGDNIDYTPYIANASEGINVILDNMDKEDFNNVSYYDHYGEIFAYNPEYIDIIIEALGIFKMERLIEDLYYICDYPEEYFHNDEDYSKCLANVNSAITKSEELIRKAKESVKEMWLEMYKDNEEVRQAIEKNEDRMITIMPVDESKFAQIYGKAKGGIKQVFSKIKLGKSQDQDKDNQDLDGRS